MAVTYGELILDHGVPGSNRLVAKIHRESGELRKVSSGLKLGIMA